MNTSARPAAGGAPAWAYLHRASDAVAMATAAVRRTELTLAARDGGSVVVSVWDPAIVEGLRAVKFGASPAVAMDAATAEDPVGGRLDRG